MKTFCFALLLAAIAHQAHGAANCTAQANPTMTDAELVNPEFTFDFDVVPTLVVDWNGTVALNVSAGPLVVTLRGSDNCGVWNSFGLGSGQWTGGSPWYPLDVNSTTPGYFLGLNNDVDTYCEIVFSEAVSQFSMRVASDQAQEAGLFIYNESDQELNCNLFPFAGATTNAYSVRGFNSTTRSIKKIVIKDSFATADLLSFVRCPAGLDWSDGKCIGQCADGACGANTNCTNIDGTPQCTCVAHYVGNATLGCAPATCATSGATVCNVHATCSDINSEPFITCACNSGYTGTGYGQDGCTAVTTPSSGPIAASPRAKTSSGSAFGLWTAATSLIIAIASIF